MPTRAGPEKVSRRDELIDATIRVIGRKGLGGASIRAIAHEVGLTIGVVTHHFRDKSALLCAALEFCFRPWRELIETSRAIADPAERLRHVMRQSVAPGSNPRPQMQVWLGMLSQIDIDPEVAEAYQKKYSQTRKDTVDLLHDCERQGLLAEGVVLEEAAAHLLSLGDGLLVSSVGEPGQFTASFIEKIMMAQVEALLRPRDQA